MVVPWIFNHGDFPWKNARFHWGFHLVENASISLRSIPPPQFTVNKNMGRGVPLEGVSQPKNLWGSYILTMVTYTPTSHGMILQVPRNSLRLFGGW